MPVIIASEAGTIASETLFVLALIVIAGPLLAEKARLPGLIGFMLGGTLLGPFVFNVLEAGQFDGIGGLGILYLMFLAGLELDMDIFNRYRKAAGQFGVLTFALPFAIGWWAGLQLDLGSAAAILIGSIWASHTLVALPIVKRAGLSGSRAVAVAAGATIITDTLALIVLAVISSGATEADPSSSGGLETIIKLSVGLAVLVFVTMWVFPRVGHWFFSGPGNDRSLRFMFLIGAMALAGLISEWGGIEGIVGAFFAGLGLNRLVPKRSNLMEKIEFFGSAFFIPAFLISVGMLINPALLFDLETLKLAGAFLLIVASGKAIAAAAGGAFFKFSWAENGLLFSLTIGQAAATLAATLVGVNIGLLSTQILNAVVLAVLVTVLVSSVLTKVFSGLVEPEKTIFLPIGSSVVVPIPPALAATTVLHLAGLIARANTGTVTPMVVIPSEQFSSEENAIARETVEKAEAAASTSGAEAEGLVRVDASVKAAVLNVVAERTGSLIMLVAPHGRRLSELAFGGPIQSIGGASPVPTVLAVGVGEMPSRLVVIVPGRPRTLGDQVDSQVAIDIMGAISSMMTSSGVALIGAGAPVPSLPDGTEVRNVVKINEETMSAVLQPGDLVIAPLGTVRRYLTASGEQGVVSAGVGLLITAGPHRLRTEGSESEDVSSILGYTQL